MIIKSLNGVGCFDCRAFFPLSYLYVLDVCVICVSKSCADCHVKICHFWFIKYSKEIMFHLMIMRTFDRDPDGLLMVIKSLNGVGCFDCRVFFPLNYLS